MILIFLLILGLSLWAYFSANTDLIPNGKTVFESADLLLPHYIVIGLPVGITGLVIAGLLAAAMSSLSSGVNSGCLVISEDFISRFRKQKLSELAHVKLAKIISLMIGVIVVVASLIIGKIKGNLMEVTFKTANLLTAPLFVPFFMAFFIKQAKETAVFGGTIISVIVAVLVGFSNEILKINIPFVWIVPAAFVAGIIVSTILSLLYPNRKQQQ